MSGIEKEEDSVRSKLAYLLAPTPARQRMSEDCPSVHEVGEYVPPEDEHPTHSQETETHQTRTSEDFQPVHERGEDFPLEDAHPIPPQDVSVNDDSEVARLREELRELRQAMLQRPSNVLGIKHAFCGGCGAEHVAEGRAFVQFGKLYCERCWSQWERCGRWHPTMRISTSLPPIGANGHPHFDAEDSFFVPEFACRHADLSLLERIQNELPEGKEFSDWHGARHLGMHFDDADVSSLRLDSAPPTLRELTHRLEKAFGIKASAARLNLYRSSDDYKPLHADRGRDSNGVPQVTVGLSLGATRELSFTHYQTGITLTFPQQNGDVFVFTPELNKVFLHGIPRKRANAIGALSTDEQRVSFILWGSRVTLLEPAELASS